MACAVDVSVFLPAALVQYCFGFTIFSFSGSLSSCKNAMKMCSGKPEERRIKDVISDGKDLGTLHYQSAVF